MDNSKKKAKRGKPSKAIRKDTKDIDDLPKEEELDPHRETCCCGELYHYSNKNHGFRCFYERLKKNNPDMVADFDIRRLDSDVISTSDSDLQSSYASGSDEEGISDLESDGDNKSSSSSSDSSSASDTEESSAETDGKSQKPKKMDYNEYFRCGSTEPFGPKQMQCDECLLYFDEKRYFGLHNRRTFRDRFDSEKGKGKTPAEHPKDLYLPEDLHKTSDGQFKCPWDNCRQTFNTESRLKQHWKSHTSEKGYDCQTCGKSFGNSRGAIECEVSHSFPFSQEDLQKMVNEKDPRIEYCSVSEGGKTEADKHFQQIYVKDEDTDTVMQSNFAVCNWCTKVLAINTARNKGRHACKAANADFPFSQEDLQKMVNEKDPRIEYRSVSVGGKTDVDDKFLRIYVKDEDTDTVMQSNFAVCNACTKVLALSTARKKGSHTCKAATADFPFSQEDIQKMVKENDPLIEYCSVSDDVNPYADKHIKRICVKNKDKDTVMQSKYVACIDCAKVLALGTSRDKRNHICTLSNVTLTATRTVLGSAFTLSYRPPICRPE